VKTISLKKVSAVAVASLGFGLLSVVPAQAAISLPLWIDTATTVGGVAITADTATVTRTLNTQVNAAAVKTITAPAGSAIIFTVKTGGTFVTTNIIDMYIDGIIVQSGTTLGTAATAVTVTRNLPSPSVTTTFNFNLKVYDTAGADRSLSALTADLPVAITVVPASGYSNSLSQAFIVAGNAGTIATSATDLLPVSVSKTAVTTNAGSILINAFDATNTAMATPGTVTVTVSGSGALSSTFTNTTNTPTASQCSATTNARVVTFTADAVNNIIICADGTSGTGTYTVSMTNAAGVTTTLATKTVIFFGSVSKIVATPVLTIGSAGGGTTGVATAARTTAAIIPAVIVKATDSSGNVVTGLTISALSSDVTVVNSAITINADTAGSAFSSGGAGFYNASFSTPSSAVSGAKATLTFRILDPADVLGVAFLTSVVNITIGGTVATEVLSFNKTSYAPGEAMVVTITATDSKGNPVADGSASPAVTFSKAVGGTAPAASVYVGGKKATSATAPTVFAPAVAGAFSALATSGNTAGSAITASSTVTDANAGLLTQIDALNAKIVALNALIAKIMKKLGVK